MFMQQLLKLKSAQLFSIPLALAAFAQYMHAI